jgi:hypothetical protein
MKSIMSPELKHKIILHLMLNKNHVDLLNQDDSAVSLKTLLKNPYMFYQILKGEVFSGIHFDLATILKNGLGEIGFWFESDELENSQLPINATITVEKVFAVAKTMLSCLEDNDWKGAVLHCRYNSSYRKIDRLNEMLRAQKEYYQKYYQNSSNGAFKNFANMQQKIQNMLESR